MFARLSTAVLALTLVAGVVAYPTEVEYEQCNGGTVQCCNTTQDSKNLSHTLSGFLGLLDIDVSQLTGQVGVECTAVNVFAVAGGQSCTQQKVCCSNNNFNGVVALGCTPVSVSV